MKISLQQLLPTDISNEAVFHLIQFLRGLSFALESIYFDQMLTRPGECEYDAFPWKKEDAGDDPF